MKLPWIKIKNQKGQTLLEALAASAVILIGIISAVSLLIYSINIAQVNSLKIQAHYLAVEGIESIRATRDSKTLNLFNFPDFVSGRYVTEDKYILPRLTRATYPDTNYSLFPVDATCSDHECYNLIDNESSPMFYDFSIIDPGDELTPFKRYLALYRICEGDLVLTSPVYDGRECADIGAGLEQIGVRANSVVLFNIGTKEYEYMLEEDFYNWKYASDI